MNGLAAQLHELRLRAGNPPVRTIERLILRQGRPEKMRRSTIQEKFSGRSTIKLWQALCLVEALAEHARLMGSPLSPHEIDQSVWRDRVVASQNKSRPSGSPKGSNEAEVNSRAAWNVEPLIQAGMTDVAELVLNSHGTSTSSWIPYVAGEMLRAQMSCESFMKAAAADPPLEVVRTLVALSEKFPPSPIEEGDLWAIPDQDNLNTVQALLMFAARIHGLRSTPTIVAGLRRAGAGNYVEDFLLYVARWHLAPRIDQISQHLRRAELSQDAKDLLIQAGAERDLERMFEVVSHFDNQGDSISRNFVLEGVARGGPERMVIALDESIGRESEAEIQDALFRSVPWGKGQDYAEVLREAGFTELAEKVDEYYADPPF